MIFSGLSGYRLAGPKMTFPISLRLPEKFLPPGDLCFRLLEWGSEIQWQRKEVCVLPGISPVGNLSWLTAREGEVMALSFQILTIVLVKLVSTPNGFSVLTLVLLFCQL